jgi:hypothetical protein
MPLGSRFSHSLDNHVRDGGEVVSLTRRQRVTPSPPLEKILVLVSVKGWVEPRAVVRLEG